MVADSVTCIDLVRHGEVVTPGLFCAPPDEPLSEAGWQQLSHTISHTTGDISGQYAAILSSPSRRCAEFAQQLAADSSAELHLVSAVQEMDFGRWIGQPVAAIWQQEAALLQSLWQSPLDFIAPDGEAMTAFVARVQTVWREMLAGYAGQKILVFTHGGVIRVLLGLALDIPYLNTLGFELAYGSATRLKVYADGTVGVNGVGLLQLPAG